MATKTRPFDLARYLESEEDIAAYLSEALATGDMELIMSAIGDVARARGMQQIARESDVSRESLYRSLSASGNPEFATILRVMKSLGVKLAAQPIKA